MSKLKDKKIQSYLFFGACAVVLIFFLMAPESTTPKMPRDANHPKKSTDFMACFECHLPADLPENHTVDGKNPPEGKSKCYFCHKLEKSSDQ
jgi:hypothetical protein